MKQWVAESKEAEACPGKDLILRATNFIPNGEEIWSTYHADPSDAHLVRVYGFMYPSNPHNCFEWTPGLDQQDPLKTWKQNFIYEHAFTLALRPGALDEIIGALRVVYSEDKHLDEKEKTVARFLEGTKKLKASKEAEILRDLEQFIKRILSTFPPKEMRGKPLFAKPEQMTGTLQLAIRFRDMEQRLLENVLVEVQNYEIADAVARDEL